MNESLTRLFIRDLEKVKHELEQVSQETDLWKLGGQISNSIGHLALHLAGNIQHFIGHVLGGNGYQRDREREFNATNVSKDQLLKELNDAIDSVKHTIPQIKDSTWSSHFPIDVFGKPMTTEEFVFHLLSHLNYHLGQINYARRILI
jgi:uncharacterized damage-inducible protein DinB